MNNFRIGLVLLGILLVCLGCQGQSSTILPVQCPSLQNIHQSQTHLWGLSEVNIDPATSQVTVTLMRGSEFTANVVNFLNSKPASMSFFINKIDPQPAYTDIDIDVTLKHPFPGMTQYNGYDVRGIFMGDGSSIMQFNDGLVVQNLSQDGGMLTDPLDNFGGPDGYSRWFNQTEFSEGGMPLLQYTKGKLATPDFNSTATLCPYKYFADSLGKTDDLWTWLSAHPGTRGVFSSGTSNTRNYYLRFPAGKGIKFNYAVIADWKGDKPQDHPANASEAVALSVVDNSTVYYVDPAVNGGDLKLDISVWNWDAQLSAGVMEDYRLIVESTVLQNPYISDSADMTPKGGGENYSTYQLDIPADNVTGLNNNEYWVIVEEKDHTYTNPFGVPNQAQNDPVSACFQYNLTVLDINPICPIPIPSAITGSPQFNNTSHTATITSTNLVGTTGLAVYLDQSGIIDGTYAITGTGITNVNVAAGTFDATFDLNGANPGSYYVIVTNSCGETGRSDTKLFVIKELVVGDIYVSNHQDFDGKPQSGTQANPYHTIAQAVNVAYQKIILVDYGRGTYPEEIYIYTNNFTLRAYNWYSDSGRPLIGGPTCTASTQAAVLTFTYNHDILIQGFKIAFAGGSSYSDCRQIFLTGAYNITFKDIYFTGDASQQWTHIAYVIDGTYCHDCTFVNCLFADLNGGTNASAYDSFDIRGVSTLFGNNMTVKQCEFTRFQSKPVNPVGTYGIYIFPVLFQLDYGNFQVHNNLFHHIAPTFSDGNGHSISNFTMINGGPYTGADPGGLIYNNTIDSCDAGSNPANYGSNIIAIRNANGDPAFAYADCYNNIISTYHSGPSQVLFGVQDINKSDYTNIWHALRGSVEYPWYDPLHEGTGCIYQDPKFVNNTTEPYDYNLDTGSPCIGTGKTGTDMGCYGGLDPGEVIGLLGPED